jgi:hypothetical protein
MLIIPFKEPAQWQEQIELDGLNYIFVFTWNALNEFWTMDLYNRDEEPLVQGIKIVPNYPLLQAYTFIGKPPGEIICQNVVNAPQEIKRFDMAQKFQLVYYAEGELEELLASLEA